MGIKIEITGPKYDDFMFRFVCTLEKQAFLDARFEEIIELALTENKKIDVTIFDPGQNHYLSFSNWFTLESEIVYDSILFYTIKKKSKVVFADLHLYRCVSELAKLVREEVLANLKALETNEVTDHEVA